MKPSANISLWSYSPETNQGQEITTGLFILIKNYRLIFKRYFSDLITVLG
jgi:hypothetical protein